MAAAVVEAQVGVSGCQGDRASTAVAGEGVQKNSTTHAERNELPEKQTHGDVQEKHTWQEVRALGGAPE